jgi:hypothetical protein
VRQLGDNISAPRAELKTTQAALPRAEKEPEREQVRSSWISEFNDRLRAELDAIERDPLTGRNESTTRTVHEGLIERGLD